MGGGAWAEQMVIAGLRVHLFYLQGLLVETLGRGNVGGCNVRGDQVHYLSNVWIWRK
jgi:hypothetical protein